MPHPTLSARCIASLATLPLVLTLAACTDSATPTPTFGPIPTLGPVYDVEAARAELAAARERWEASGSAGYSFQAEYRCHFCDFHDEPLEVIVRNGAIRSVVHIDSGARLNAGDHLGDINPFRTIDALFGLIESALRPGREAHRLSVRYYPIGYPASISIYEARGAADAGSFGVRLKQYEPIGPNAPLAPTPMPEPDADELLTELAAARALWNSRGSDDYTIDYAVFIHAYTIDLPLRLTVRSGALEEATSLDEQLYGAKSVPLDDVNIARDVLAIDVLFHRIEEALRERQSALERDQRSAPRDSIWNVRVAYDLELGYPREFTITDRSRSEAEGWFRVSLRNYKPLVPAEESSPDEDVA